MRAENLFQGAVRLSDSQANRKGVFILMYLVRGCRLAKGGDTIKPHPKQWYRPDEMLPR